MEEVYRLISDLKILYEWACVVFDDYALADAVLSGIRAVQLRSRT